MKIFFVVSFLVMLTKYSFAQSWTAAQLESANTAKNLPDLTAAEKRLIQYINLCRMYPASFAVNEVELFTGIPGIADKSLGKYKKSLLKELAIQQPCKPLRTDPALIKDAKCFSGELRRTNRVGHQREDCPDRQYAECLSFGNESAREVILEWLIDSGVANLGHRRNCLNPSYEKVGVSIAAHISYGQCAVAEFGD